MQIPLSGRESTNIMAPGSSAWNTGMPASAGICSVFLLTTAITRSKCFSFCQSSLSLIIMIFGCGACLNPSMRRPSIPRHSYRLIKPARSHFFRAVSRRTPSPSTAVTAAPAFEKRSESFPSEKGSGSPPCP